MTGTRPSAALLALVLASSATARAVAAEPSHAAAIDTTSQAEPISPYVYGQFIEHLGRCIYGGLWAEMLEDRKFYYAVDGRSPAWTLFTPGPRSWDGEGHPYELLTRSPWMVLGDPGAVTMETGAPFVGEHTPRIALPGDGERGGLVQGELNLVRDRPYVGRVVLAGDATAGPVEVSLVWGRGAGDRASFVVESVGAEFATSRFELRSGGDTDAGRLEISSRGSGQLLIGTASLMPADNLRGWRADTVAAVRQLRSPVYRWPGGNFVSGYDWRDGIGDPDRRPPRKNPAWTGIESNDVGIHEYMDLMRELDTEPFIAVNTGLGGAEEAAAELEYVNGSADTELGRLRAEHGHPEPFGVRFWAVGNEMYGDWQLGHMPLADYVKKHNDVVDAMRGVDPEFVPIAVGAVGEWSQQMLTTCSDHMGLLSEHLYWQDEEDLVKHVFQIRDGIRGVADAHRGYRKELPSLAGKDIRIALDEWNYWYGANEFGELGVRYFLQDALGIAVGLHEMFRNSDLFYMANYAQTVNVIGAIKTTATEAELETTGLVLALYRERFGEMPLAVSGDLEPLDVAAAWSADRVEVTVAAVNPTPEVRRLDLEWKGARASGKARRWVLAGSDRMSFNSPGRERQVDVVSDNVDLEGGSVSLPPMSVTLLAVPVG
jgi:alpha-N-arabinofuranosidase